MRIFSVVAFAFIASCFLSGCALGRRSGSSVVGVYHAEDGKSTISLDADGTFTIEECGGDMNLEFLVLGGRWTKVRDQVTLSWADASKEDMSPRSVVYTFIEQPGGAAFRLSSGQRLPVGLLENPMGVIICARYKKEPNKSATANALDLT